MSENETIRKPDNVIQLEVGRATVEIREFFTGPDTLNDIIVRRIKQDANPYVPTGENV
jgi:hypothetical protein